MRKSYSKPHMAESAQTPSSISAHSKKLQHSRTIKSLAMKEAFSNLYTLDGDNGYTRGLPLLRKSPSKGSETHRGVTITQLKGSLGQVKRRQARNTMFVGGSVNNNIFGQSIGSSVSTLLKTSGANTIPLKAPGRSSITKASMSISESLHKKIHEVKDPASLRKAVHRKKMQI